MNKDLQEVIKIAKKEAIACVMAQANGINFDQNDSIVSPLISDFTGYRCYIYGSWKKIENLSGVG